mmetsp:Transcript_40023/g.110167  ORF Transcript_40023/g.110167 Transcript_40023/m.110167 type:complete len:229 (-) Transcript_40023:343-1029(-)
MPWSDSLICSLDARAESLERPSVKTSGGSSMLSLRVTGTGAPPSKTGSVPASLRSTRTSGLVVWPPSAASCTALRSSEATMYCVHWSKWSGLDGSSLGSVGLAYSIRMRIEKISLTNEGPPRTSPARALPSSLLPLLPPLLVPGLLELVPSSRSPRDSATARWSASSSASCASVASCISPSSKLESSRYSASLSALAVACRGCLEVGSATRSPAAAESIMEHTSFIAT